MRTNNKYQREAITGLRRCWRGLMRAWAKRWRVISRDPIEREQANLCLQEAMRCREKAKRIWTTVGGSNSPTDNGVMSGKAPGSHSE